jgi:probable rRNA maturation factor
MSRAAKKSSSFRLSLAVQYASGAQPMPTRSQFRRWIKAALQCDANITLRIVDEPEGHALNKKFRGKDYATNVLTFVYDNVQPLPQSAGPASNAAARGRPRGTPLLRSDPFALSQPQPRHGWVEPLCTGVEAERLFQQSADPAGNISQPLPGDVVICAPVVEKEAREQGKDLLEHYAHLAIHSILHLQGYEHGRAADAAAMESLETAIMLKLGYADPYQGAVS